MTTDEELHRVFTVDLESALWARVGKWVALGTNDQGTCDRIIAVGDSPTEVLNAAAGTGDPALYLAPVLYFVPDPNVSHFFPVSR